MPIYDYYCKGCDKKVGDVSSKMGLRYTICPYCGEKMVRMPASPTIIFKGEGWESNSKKKKPV